MRRVYKLALIFVIAIAPFIILTQYTNALIPFPKTEFKLDPKIIACAVISSNIDKKIEAFEDYKSTHLENYTKLYDRITQMVVQWKEWGYNTGDIEDDLDDLDGKIDEFKDHHDDFITKLKDVKSACGSDTFAAKVTAAKTALKTVRSDVVDIRVFYQTVLRKHIVELKSQTID